MTFIRKMDQYDVPPAFNLMVDEWGESTATRIKDEIYDSFLHDSDFAPEYYVALNDVNQLVGFAGFVQSHLLNGIYELNGICIRNDCRNKGIGRELTEKRICRIYQLGGTLILAMTKQVLFFEKLGFKSQFSVDDWHMMTMKLGSVSI